MSVVKKKAVLIGAIVIMSMQLSAVHAQEIYADSVISQITNTIRSGNTDSLAMYFNQRLELTLPGFSAISSRNQAKMVIGKFIAENAPTAFSVTNQNESTTGFFVVGTMHSGEKSFRVSFLTKELDSKQTIYQLSIE